MRKLFSLTLGSVVLASSLFAVPVAEAAPTDKTHASVKKIAKKMKCKKPQKMHLMGPSNSGVSCRVASRGEFLVLRYAKPDKGVAYFKRWLRAGCPTGDYKADESDYLVRKGKVLIHGNQSADSYTLASARYAAKKTGGRIINLCPPSVPKPKPEPVTPDPETPQAYVLTGSESINNPECMNPGCEYHVDLVCAVGYEAVNGGYTLPSDGATYSEISNQRLTTNERIWRIEVRRNSWYFHPERSVTCQPL